MNVQTEKTLNDMNPEKSNFCKTGVFGGSLKQNPLDITLVVPCLNEELNILSTLEEIRRAFLNLPYSFEVIIINDGSTDKTEVVVNKYLQENSNFPGKLHSNGKNLGLSTSCFIGAYLGSGEYFAVISGDHVEPAESITKVILNLGKADLVISYDQHISRPAYRRVISGMYGFLVNILSGYDIHYYNGMTLFRREHYILCSSRAYGFGFRADTITRILDSGGSYEEVEIVIGHCDKPQTDSSLNFRNFCSVAHTLVEIFIRRVRKLVIKR